MHIQQLADHLNKLELGEYGSTLLKIVSEMTPNVLDGFTKMFLTLDKEAVLAMVKLLSKEDSQDTDALDLAHLHMGVVLVEQQIPGSKDKLLEHYCDTMVGIRSYDEYIILVSIYLAIGAKIWPLHNGYKPLGDDPHHCYAVQECGILKMSGGFETMEPTFKDVNEFILDVRTSLGKIQFGDL